MSDRPPTLFEKIREDLRVFDFSKMPDTKMGWVIRALVTIIAIAFLIQRVKAATSPLVSHAEPIRRPSKSRS